MEEILIEIEQIKKRLDNIESILFASPKIIGELEDIGKTLPLIEENIKHLRDLINDNDF